LAQTFGDFEWLVQDGASSDETVTILSQLEESVSWRSEPDDGLYHGMNRALERARGDFVIFLNSGDTFASGTVLEEVAALIHSKNVDLVYGDALETDGRLLYSKPARSHWWCWLGMFTHHQAMFFRRKFLRGPFFDTSYEVGADYALVARFLKEGAVAHNARVNVCVFERGGLSARKAGTGRDDNWRVQSDILELSLPTKLLARIMLLASALARHALPKLYAILRFRTRSTITL
jgi:putative colanic acid biosynthesis glycosyltransferase